MYLYEMKQDRMHRCEQHSLNYYRTNMATGLLKDKALIYWENMALTETWDFQVVASYEVILQAAQNRVISYLETRKFDDNFWSEIQKALHNMPAMKITNNMMNTYVNFALQPMVLDGRIKTVDSVKIIDRSTDSLTIEIILTLGTYSGSIVVEMQNFIN